MQLIGHSEGFAPKARSDKCPGGSRRPAEDPPQGVWAVWHDFQVRVVKQRVRYQAEDCVCILQLLQYCNRWPPYSSDKQKLKVYICCSLRGRLRFCTDRIIITMLQSLVHSTSNHETPLSFRLCTQHIITWPPKIKLLRMALNSKWIPNAQIHYV